LTFIEYNLHHWICDGKYHRIVHVRGPKHLRSDHGRGVPKHRGEGGVAHTGFFYLHQFSLLSHKTFTNRFSVENKVEGWLGPSLTPICTSTGRERKNGWAGRGELPIKIFFFFFFFWSIQTTFCMEVEVKKVEKLFHL
jgi:hypothetical protein